MLLEPPPPGRGRILYRIEFVSQILLQNSLLNITHVSNGKHTLFRAGKGLFSKKHVSEIQIEKLRHPFSSYSSLNPFQTARRVRKRKM